MAGTGLIQRTFGKAFDIRPGEARAVAWSFAYFFFVLACYYVLRPVRDEMGVRSGVGNLPKLFTATFVVSLAIAPIFAVLVAKLRRTQFIPLVYGFLLINILAFWALLAGGIAVELLAKVFFVWLTVFAVFAVSTFWSFMADFYAGDQAKRLYPTIAAGGALGGFAGSSMVAAGLPRLIGPANLLLVAAVLLALALFAATRLDRAARDPAATVTETAAAKPVEGGWLAGLIAIFRSTYLAGIALWVFLLSLGGTFAYSMQIDIIDRANLDSAARVELFGRIDLAANILIPLIQLVITRWALKRLGVGVTLGLAALVYIAGFAVMSVHPVLPVLVAFMIVSRAGTFALSNPARESLWPVVDREDKYKAKNVVDNAVFRGSDMATAWLFRGLNQTMGLSLSAIAMIGAPVMALWFILSVILGRARERRAAQVSEGALP